MKVLMISLDNSISDRRSDSVSRMKKYAALVDELHILVFGGHEGHWSEGNLFVYSVPAGSKAGAFFAARRLGKKIVKEKQIDVITSQDPFFTGLLGLLIKRAKTGLNIELHGDYYNGKFWHDKSPWWPLRLRLGQFVMRRADGIRVMSERQRKSLVEKLKILPEKIIKVPVYVPVNAQITESAIDLHSKFHTPWIILGIGGLRPEKNFIAAIKAMPKILEGCPGAHLVIIGGGPEERRLKSYAGRRGLSDNVHFLGAMNYNKTMAHLRQADVLLIPSLSESWSRVAVEAAAGGVPVAMNNVGLANEVLLGGESGEIFNEPTPENIADAVSKILKDGMLANRYRAAAKAAVAKLPSEEETLCLIKESWEKVSRNSQ